MPSGNAGSKLSLVRRAERRRRHRGARLTSTPGPGRQYRFGVVDCPGVDPAGPLNAEGVRKVVGNMVVDKDDHVAGPVARLGIDELRAFCRVLEERGWITCDCAVRDLTDEDGLRSQVLIQARPGRTTARQPGPECRNYEPPSEPRGRFGSAGWSNPKANRGQASGFG